MSNESIKRSAPPPESTTTDILPAELSADLMTGYDPLDYDWTGAAEGQSSEADDAPPMQVQATDLDTWDLAEAIRLETARITQYASSRNPTVIIGGGSTIREPVFDVETDDGPPTQRMPTAPARKEDDGSMPGASSDGWNRTSTIASLLVGSAALFLFAIYFLARPGVASTLSAGEVLIAAPPVVPNSLHEAGSAGAPCKAPEAPQQRDIPTRTLERAATGPSRAASPPREVASKSGSVDPLFVKSPGY